MGGSNLMSASAGRVLIIPKGAWNSATTYNMLDAVSYQGSMFIAKRQNTNVTPVDGADWFLSAQGTAGAQVLSFNGRTGAVVPANGDYNLPMLSDVNLTSLANGQVLKYNSTTQKWENAEDTGGLLPHLIIIAETGESVVKAVKGQTEIIATETSTGHYECDVPEFGTWTIHAVLNGEDATVNLVVDTVKVYTVDDSHFHADITVTYPSGATCSCSKTGETTLYATGSPYTFTVHSSGTWTITVTVDGKTYTQTVSISTSGQTESLTMPTGSTVTPTDDVKTLLHCAGIGGSSISTLADLLADSTTLLAVINSHNAIDYLVRSTTFASGVCANSTAMLYIGLNNYASNTLLADSTWLNAIVSSDYIESVLNVKIPTMTSDSAPSGSCSASSVRSGYNAYKAFDGDDSTPWQSNDNNVTSGEYVAYTFDSAVKVVGARINVLNLLSSSVTETLEIDKKSTSSGSWNVLKDNIEASLNASSSKTINVSITNTDTAVKFYRLYLKSATTNVRFAINTLQLYGRADV